MGVLFNLLMKEATLLSSFTNFLMFLIFQKVLRVISNNMAKSKSVLLCGTLAQSVPGKFLIPASHIYSVALHLVWSGIFTVQPSLEV